MKKNIFHILCFLLLLIACAPIKKHRSASIVQGIEGFVYTISGNQMPAPNIQPLPTQPLSDTIYIFELTNITNTSKLSESGFYTAVNSKLLAKTVSNKKGYFILSLPTGDYSVFLKVKGFFYANTFDAKNNIAPVKVNNNSITKIDIKQDAYAIY